MTGELWRPEGMKDAGELNVRLRRILYFLADGRLQSSFPGISEVVVKSELSRAMGETYTYNAVQLVDTCINTDAMAGLGWLERPRVLLKEKLVQVLELRALGYSNDMVADEMAVAPDTVRSRVREVLRLMSAESMLHAVVLYRLQEVENRPWLRCLHCGMRLRFFWRISEEGRKLAGWDPVKVPGPGWASCQWCAGVLRRRRGDGLARVAAHLAIEPDQVEELLSPRGVMAGQYLSRIDAPEVKRWVLKMHVSKAMGYAQIARILHSRWEIRINSVGVRETVLRWITSGAAW